MGKGSWKRPEDKTKNNRGYTGEDYGTCGCRNGHGLYHPISNETGKCLYCNYTPEQIQTVQKLMENKQ